MMKGTPNGKRTQQAFTLLEMLVTIGIILTVAALCFPAVQKVRGRALTAKCAGNLKNLGAGLNLYVADNKYFPGAMVNAGTWWIQVVEEYAASGPQQSLSTLSSIVECPARAPGTGTFGIGYGYNYGGFGFSENSAGGAPLPPDQMPPRYWNVAPARVESPSKTIIIADSMDTPAPGTYGEMYLYLNNFDVLAKRHNEGGNYLFVDGHIEWLTPKAVKKLFEDGDNRLPMFPF